MGSGPFKLETLDVEGVTVMVANDDYWDGPPGVKAVEIYGIAESEAQTTALLSGQLDWQGVNLDIAQRFEGNPDFNITQIPSGDWSGLVMRTDIEPFNNLPLRQAMHYVVDRQKLVDLSLSGAGTVSCDSSVMPSDPNVLSECSYEQDFDAARAKLEEAGRHRRQSCNCFSGWFLDRAMDGGTVRDNLLERTFRRCGPQRDLSRRRHLERILLGCSRVRCFAGCSPR